MHLRIPLASNTISRSTERLYVPIDDGAVTKRILQCKVRVLSRFQVYRESILETNIPPFATDFRNQPKMTAHRQNYF